MQGNISHIKLYNLVMSHIENETTSLKKVDIYNYDVDDFEPILIHELLMNIRLIIENEKLNNLQSMGVDICCRILIEISALLKASREGKLTDTQKKLFLLNYLAGDIQKQSQKGSQNDEISRILNAKYDKVINEYQSLLNLDYKDAEYVSKGYFNFLQYGGTKSYKNFTGFVATILGTEFVSYRGKIDIFIHPSYTESELVVFNENLGQEREKIINRVLTLASSFVPPFESEGYVKSKWNNEYISEEYLSVIKNVKKVFKATFKFHSKDDRWNETKLSNHYDRWVLYSCFRKLEAALVDTFVCESLNLRTKSITRCKAFVEMTSMVGAIIKSEHVSETISEFVKFSALAVKMKESDSHEMFKKVDAHKKLNDKEEKMYLDYLADMDDWFGDFKNNHGYPENEFEFAMRVRDSNLYFLSEKENYSYPNLVHDTMNYYLKGTKTLTQLFNDYLWAEKIGHACAYQNLYRENKSFNLIPNMIDYLIVIFNKTFDTIVDEEDFCPTLTSIADNIREQNKANHEQMLSSKYKIVR